MIAIGKLETIGNSIGQGSKQMTHGSERSQATPVRLFHEVVSRPWSPLALVFPGTSESFAERREVDCKPCPKCTLTHSTRPNSVGSDLSAAEAEGGLSFSILLEFFWWRWGLMQTLPPSRKSDQSLQLWAALVNDIGHHVARCDSLPVPKLGRNSD